MRRSLLIIVLGVCTGLAGVVPWLARDRHPTHLTFPEDIDLTELSVGTLTTFVDPARMEMTPPQEEPLTVRRRLRTVGPSGSTVAVAEDQTLTAKTPTARRTFELSLHQLYVLDRQSMKSVVDKRAFAYEQKNVVDRAPYYTVGLLVDSTVGLPVDSQHHGL